jgi:hypothetical protein
VKLGAATTTAMSSTVAEGGGGFRNVNQAAADGVTAVERIASGLSPLKVRFSAPFRKQL